MFCAAMNARLKDTSVGWFAVLHSDVEPEAWWVDKLIAEADANHADMLSVVIPIKDETGRSSTAIAGPDLVQTCRPFDMLTMQQVSHSLFPRTFAINDCCNALAQLPGQLRVANAPREALLLNTGCFVLRLTANIDWSKIWFSMHDGIERTSTGFHPVNISEDWLFSYRVAQQGGRCMATTAVKVVHHGRAGYPNQLHIIDEPNRPQQR